MVGVTLGAKAKNYDFNVSDIDLDTLEAKGPNYSISAAGITISENKSNYVRLEGQFKLWSLMDGDYGRGIQKLNSITVVENGKVSYTASGLDMSGKDVATGALFREFLAGENYSIKGNASANEITAGDHRDVILGLSGNDLLSGMGGNDRLSGDIGNDHLIGGEGRDSLSGGWGSDTFVFNAGDGIDVITDFQAYGRGQDHIDLSGHDGVSSFDDLIISQTRSTVRIEVGDDVLILKGVAEFRIDTSDFLF